MTQQINEIWKQYKDTNYEVSNLGNVRNIKTKRMLKAGEMKNGYLHVVLSDNGKHKTITVHRLVAETFIPNPDNLPEVNHKDEDKTNNFCGTSLNNYTDGNLEWCTQIYNAQYSKNKTILQLKKDGSLVRVWPSAMNVQNTLSYNQGHISACCLGKRHSANGYKWCYAKQ